VASTVARQRLTWVASAGVLLLLVLGVAVWRLARRLPVEQARQFMTAPIELGAQPPAAPDASVARAVIAQRFAGARADFAAGRYP
jgi:hypothetical protein